MEGDKALCPAVMVSAEDHYPPGMDHKFTFIIFTYIIFI